MNINNRINRDHATQTSSYQNRNNISFCSLILRLALANLIKLNSRLSIFAFHTTHLHFIPVLIIIFCLLLDHKMPILQFLCSLQFKTNNKTSYNEMEILFVWGCTQFWVLLQCMSSRAHTHISVTPRTSLVTPFQEFRQHDVQLSDISTLAQAHGFLKIDWIISAYQLND